MQGKIAVEEHYELPPVKAAANNAFKQDYLDDAQRRLHDRESRIQEMDKCGIAWSFMSLTEPGVQGMIDPRAAIDLAKRCNDHVCDYYLAAYPTRFGGLAVLPMQDPEAAADELERTVRQLGFRGAMINGFTNTADENRPLYLDAPEFWPFWDCVQNLSVPIFLHPRVPLPSQRLAFAGYEGIAGSAWGFGRETAEHAIRMILSGLFDRFPKVTIVLGHLGEGLTFALPRMDHRLRHQSPASHGRHLKPPSQYLRENFYLSTSGILRTQALLNALTEVGADRILFAVDTPFESAREISAWFDDCPISETDRAKIGFGNAARLLGLPTDGRVLP